MYGVDLKMAFIKTLSVWFIVVVMATLIILFPRETEPVVQTIDVEGGGQYEILTQNNIYSAEMYKENIAQLVSNIHHDRSIGDNRYGIPVEQDILYYMPRSLSVVFLAFLISIPLGVLKGTFDYAHMGKRTSIFGQGTTWLFHSLPDFFVIMGLQFSLLMLMRRGFPTISIYGHEHWYDITLPAVLLSIYPIVYIARITTSLLAEQVNQKYIETATAKGLTKTIILFKHALGNCWASLATHSSTIFIYIISNLMIVEYLLNYPGAANRLYQALGFRGRSFYNDEFFEPYVVLSFVLCFMILILLIQMTSLFVRYFVDPRVREGDSA